MLVALHAIKETILGFYRVKKEYKKLMDTVKWHNLARRVSFVYIAMQAVQRHSPVSFFRTLTQVGCSCNIALG